MVNAMNKVVKDCIPRIMMPFLDDILITRCSNDEKDESKDRDGCHKFIMDHIKHCKTLLQRLEDADSTFSRDKSTFCHQKSWWWATCLEHTDKNLHHTR
jgi:hypothetical protein